MPAHWQSTPRQACAAGVPPDQTPGNALAGARRCGREAALFRRPRYEEGASSLSARRRMRAGSRTPVCAIFMIVLATVSGVGWVSFGAQRA